MDLAYILTAALLLVYLVAIWILGGVLHLKSPDIWVFRLGLWIIGIGSAAALVWWRRNQRGDGGNAQPADPSNEIDVLVRDAEARLAAAGIPKGSGLGNFPLVFLLGESGSAKTSILVNSGLD